MLALFPGGERSTLYVDDFLPCMHFGGAETGPICSRSHKDDMWVMLLEKAFAKLCGGYHAIRDVSVSSAFRTMSGAPCVSLCVPVISSSSSLTSNTTASMGTFWNKLVSYASKGYVMVANTASDTHRRVDSDDATSTTRLRDERGLVFNYHYTLLSARCSSLGDHLLQLRCPLNVEKFEWTGDWSDASPKWTPELQSEFEIDCDDDDRTFWISYTDFCKSFSSVDVAMINHQSAVDGERGSWNECRRKCWLTSSSGDVADQKGLLLLHPSVVYVLRVQERATEMFLSLNLNTTTQPGFGHQRTSLSDLSAGQKIGIVVLRVTPDYCFEYVCGSDLVDQPQAEVSEILPEGVYLVVPVIVTGADGDDTDGTQSSAVVKEDDEALGEPAVGIDDQRAILFDASGRFSKLADGVLDEIFSRLDGDMDGV